MDNDSEAMCLFFTGLRAYLGRELGSYAAHEKHTWLKSAPRVCAKCRRGLKYGERTIDHIVPKAIAQELGLVELVWDKRNWQILCQPCNTEKSSEIPNLHLLPQKTIDLLRELGYPCR